MGGGKQIPLKPSRILPEETVREEDPYQPIEEASVKLAIEERLVVFQVPIESLRPVLNPDLVLGEGTGSLPATLAKGMVLQFHSSPALTLGVGISPRARDPS